MIGEKNCKRCFFKSRNKTNSFVVQQCLRRLEKEFLRRVNDWIGFVCVVSVIGRGTEIGFTRFFVRCFGGVNWPHELVGALVVLVYKYLVKHSDG